MLFKKTGFSESVITDISDENRALLKKTLEKTLEKTGWNVSKSAKMFGLTRDMMRYRIEKFGLCAPHD